jgi:hypothetical protein
MKSCITLSSCLLSLLMSVHSQKSRCLPLRKPDPPLTRPAPDRLFVAGPGNGPLPLPRAPPATEGRRPSRTAPHPGRGSGIPGSSHWVVIGTSSLGVPSLVCLISFLDFALRLVQYTRSWNDACGFRTSCAFIVVYLGLYLASLNIVVFLYAS